jgi:plasmid stability protein
MDTTIRNLDQALFRAAKSRAALQGRSIGEIVNDALRSYLARDLPERRGSLADLKPERYPRGNERLSERIDKWVYGA